MVAEGGTLEVTTLLSPQKVSHNGLDGGNLNLKYKYT